MQKFLKLQNFEIFQFVALSVFLAAACAAPQRGFDKNYNQKQVIPILKFDSQQNHDGSYRYGYETGNGIAVQEQGYVKNLGVKDSEIQTAQGFFSYTSPEGKPITLHYTADENGFQATGGFYQSTKSCLINFNLFLFKF